MVFVAVVCVLWLGFAVFVGMLASNWGRSFSLGILAALFVSPLLAGVILAFSGKTLAQRALELREIQARVDGACCKPPLIKNPAAMGELGMKRLDYNASTSFRMYLLD